MNTRKLAALVAAAVFAVAVASSAQAANITTQIVVSGLNRAVDLTVPPGDTQRLFVAERRGVIKIIVRDGGVIQGRLEMTRKAMPPGVIQTEEKIGV